MSQEGGSACIMSRTDPMRLASACFGVHVLEEDALNWHD
jgi:hypothetical protein